MPFSTQRAPSEMVWLKIPTTRHPHEESCRKRPGTTKSTKKSLSFVLFVCFVVQIAVRRVKAPGLNGQVAGSNSSIGADRLDAVIARRLGHLCGLHQMALSPGTTDTGCAPEKISINGELICTSILRRPN